MMRWDATKIVPRFFMLEQKDFQMITATDLLCVFKPMQIFWKLSWEVTKRWYMTKVLKLRLSHLRASLHYHQNQRMFARFAARPKTKIFFKMSPISETVSLATCTFPIVLKVYKNLDNFLNNGGTMGIRKEKEIFKKSQVAVPKRCLTWSKIRACLKRRTS